MKWFLILMLLAGNAYAEMEVKCCVGISGGTKGTPDYCAEADHGGCSSGVPNQNRCEDIPECNVPEKCCIFGNNFSSLPQCATVPQEISQDGCLSKGWMVVLCDKFDVCKSHNKCCVIEPNKECVNANTVEQILECKGVLTEGACPPDCSLKK